MNKRKRILKQMYDIRPTRADGILDMEKIEKSERILKILSRTTQTVSFDPKKQEKILIDISKSWNATSPKKTFFQDKLSAKSPYQEEIPPFEKRQPEVIQLGRKFPHEWISISKIPTYEVFRKTNEEDTSFADSFEDYTDFPFQEKSNQKESSDYQLEILESDISDSAEKILKPFQKKDEHQAFSKRKHKKRIRFLIFSIFPLKQKLFSLSSFASAIFLFSMIFLGTLYVKKGFDAKEKLAQSVDIVLSEIAEAKENIYSGKFEQASLNFEESFEILKNTNQDLEKIGGELSDFLRFVPLVSKIATANYLLSAGQEITLAGKKLTNSLQSISGLEKPLDQNSNISFIDLFLKLEISVSDANENLKNAHFFINKANFNDIPPEIQPRFLSLKEKLPIITTTLQSFSNDSNIILDILGYNGPRKFLFIFQNNQEMRATGGFIGSYGILDVANGRIKKLFVDDIYNPDGQLTARIIPPEPIQKMSAVWTMHDANWFPDFPTSAEKVAWFYEKTGGPTVDGVIAMTPSVIEKMLSITGPIEMPEYDTVVDKNNFVEKTQYEVEVDYDKNENRPKKFIADLTPKILDKLLNEKNPETILQCLQVLNSSLKEKHILIYSKNYNIQKLLREQNWSGEMLPASRDYLSVINTNINGYKTDGVIEETIEHFSEISEDGSITDEVTVTRRHNGGNKEYEWWNKVNADYLRIYVPEGSQLLEVSGQTREIVSPPLDYQALRFKKDPLLEQIDQEAKIDEKTGTKIYTESRKTVFANWVYVSPQETVTIKYKYRLPFKLSFDPINHPADNFSVLYQKQSGSRGSQLISKISLPDNMKPIWHWPQTIEQKENSFIMNTSLETDRLMGMAVEIKN